MQQQSGFIYDFTNYMDLDIYEGLLLINFIRVNMYSFLT